MSQRRGVREWFHTFRSRYERAFASCEATFFHRDIAPITYRPFGVLVPNRDHSRRITVPIRIDRTYTTKARPRTAYRVISYEEHGLEKALILAETLGFRPSDEALENRELKTLMIRNVQEHHLVHNNLIQLMIGCGLIYRETGIERAIYHLYRIILASVESLRQEQPTPMTYKPTLDEAVLSTAKRKHGRLIPHLDKEDKWAFRCTKCGGYTWIEAPPWPDHIRCRVCEYRDQPIV